MKSLEELAQLRAKAQEALKVREGQKETRIVVGLGTCGIAAGARETMKAILDELSKRNINDVTVSQTGCIGLCEYEPLIEVYKGQQRVTYHHVDANRARQIIASHIVNDQVAGEWVVSTK